MGEAKSNHVRPVVADPKADLRDWLSLLEELVDQIKAWIGTDWSTEKIKKPMRDSVLGPYQAPALVMQRNFTRTILEPVARYAPGTEGVVDLARMPIYDEVASLYRINGEWRLHYAFRGTKAVARPRTADSLLLDEAVLRRVLDEFAGHAV